MTGREKTEFLFAAETTMKAIILMLPYHNKSIDAHWMLLGKQHNNTQTHNTKKV